MKKIFFMIVGLLAMATLANAAEVTVTWNASERATGYKCFYGESSRTYNPAIDVGAALECHIPIAQTQDDKTYYFAATAYNQYGESEYSEEVSCVITGLHQVPSNMLINSITVNYPGGDRVVTDYSSRTITITHADGTVETKTF